MDNNSSKENIFVRIKKSIYTGSINPKDENERIRLAIKSFILHLHPRMINESTIKFNHTFGLGGMAALLFVIQVFTGILLRFVYEPFPGRAYDSIVYLQSEVLFGQLVRNVHHWSGIFLILITFLHLLRTYFTGAYHSPRQFNWVLGLILLLLVVFSNFTGYLLPWDQLAYWAITVSTNMLEYIPLIGNSLRELVLGGSEVGNSTLLLFYNFHTGIFPVLIIIVMSFHFWRVRKAGGVVIPGGDTKESKMVTTIPHLVAKEFVVALVLTALILLLSLFFDAPLLDKANPNFSPNPSKAPWYFMGIQEMIMHFHPLIGAIIIPLMLMLFLFLVPYFKYDTDNSGIWFYSEKGRSTSILSAVSAAVITISGILINEYVLDLSSMLGDIPPLISNGFIPLIIIIGILYGFYKFIKNKYAPDKNEAIQALFVFLLVSFLILTLTGIIFRGPGMMLGI
jgi:quinol-cytochrome oxidoreductase complex cytochrome b subunit